MRLFRTGFVLLLSLSATPAWAIDVDGRIDPAEWQGAQHVTDFRLTQPLSRAPSPYPTEAWILSTPEGLAVAFRNTQPASVPRTRQVVQRDAGGPYDRVNLYVDFDGEGRIGYNFMVLLSDSIQDGTITNENQFSYDWDSVWKHAVSEDGDTWSVEMLIPWSVAPMKDGSDGKRSIGVQLDRVVGTTGERVGWPAVFGGEQRFLSQFSKVEVPEYSQSLLAVTPYVSGLYDNVRGTGKFDSGVDVFWKPNGKFQLTATLNPDFGQVESDQLVVNFGAIETFFNDKRPFFTENQSFFTVPFGSRNTIDQLIYTRRVGGPADDGSGAGDVTAAVKFNGSAAGFNYGAFAAGEADPAGRDFYAARATREFGQQGLGVMATRVERPYFDRQADVFSLDHHWNPNQNFSINSAFVLSSIDQGGSTTDDSGGQTRIDYDAGGGWRQQLYLLHLGKDLELNDFGFLERNDYNYFRYGLSHRVTDLPKDSPFASHDWQFVAAGDNNDEGLTLSRILAIKRQSDYRNGGTQFFEIDWTSRGHDDLITRGNGAVRMPVRYNLFLERYFARRPGGHWELYTNIHYDNSGFRGFRYGAPEFDVEPTYHVNDTLSFYGGLDGRYNPDWLVWNDEKQVIGSYRSRLVFMTAGTNWLISPKQELRVKLQAVALEARALRAYDVAPDGNPVASSEDVPNFTLRNMGFQIRYRYELAPLSNLYVAYVRGGALYDETFGPVGVGHQFERAFDLRDSEQLFVKLNYRFEL
ncbi:MAG TPA: DUF5916 domain-containing protein [Lysobacter sp.]|nr:DUF5916 domain-containing protein [Lysobacter sp.]